MVATPGAESAVYDCLVVVVVIQVGLGLTSCYSIRSYRTPVTFNKTGQFTRHAAPYTRRRRHQTPLLVSGGFRRSCYRGEEGLEAVPPRGCRGRGPAGDLGAKPPRNWGISPNTFCVMARAFS